MNVSAIVDGTTVELTPDAVGFRGTVDLNGVDHHLHVTLTAASPRAVSPAKARLTQLGSINV